MNAIKLFIKNEISGWKFWEVAWLLIACIIISGLSIYWGDNLMGIISATTGVACVVCTGKGKLSAYIFGLVNCVLYAIISYKAKLYGETILNSTYYVFMQFYGFYIWSKNINAETNEVNKRRMDNKERLLLVVILGILTLLFGIFLKAIGDTMPYVDSFTTVASVVSMYISVKMYSEQWILWDAVNILSIIMWAVQFRNGGTDMATLLMWCVYLCNSLLMTYRWEKEARASSMRDR